jgi:aryl-alcohol dehydrogenase-like predicted oxidoreductase
VPFLNLLQARHNDIENMQKRKLGNSNLEVPAAGLGRTGQSLGNGQAMPNRRKFIAAGLAESCNMDR